MARPGLHWIGRGNCRRHYLPNRFSNLKTKISYKSSGYSDRKYPRVQFSDVGLYRFLQNIGLMPAKTKTIAAIAIPDKYWHGQ